MIQVDEVLCAGLLLERMLNTHKPFIYGDTPSLVDWSNRLGGPAYTLSGDWVCLLQRDVSSPS